jgi:hypothetical protein
LWVQNEAFWTQIGFFVQVVRDAIVAEHFITVGTGALISNEVFA